MNKHQFVKDLVGHVSSVVAELEHRRVTEYDRCLGDGESVAHGRTRRVRQIDNHAESIHFGDDSTTEIVEATEHLWIRLSVHQMSCGPLFVSKVKFQLVFKTIQN